MTKTRILKITLAVSLVFFICMSHAPQWTAVVPFIPSVAADSDDANNDPETEKLPRAAISVNVDMVSMQVLVSDNNGNVLTGLRPENFTIYEDGVKQEITHFSPMEANVTVAMLVEFSKRNEIFLDDVYNAMYGFVNTLRPGDWTAVAGYDMRTEIFSDFTQNRNEIYKALRQFAIPSWNESNLSDAIIEIIDRTQEIEGKVAILLISSGLDTFSRHTYDQALNACKSANASIYAIGIGRFARDYYDARGLISQSTNMDFLMGDNRLKSFADFTGGAAFFPRYSTELPSIFNGISTALRSQYSVGYVSSNTKRDGKFRNVKVEVATELKDKKGKPIKTKVVTRKGYTAKSF
ncbi:MAG: VWA domain-containing protein [Acidobacteriota bacterium]|jgi:VWFA-related protein|nr:VWA domain-containing protein [Acidobacteriota bacterium]